MKLDALTFALDTARRSEVQQDHGVPSILVVLASGGFRSHQFFWSFEHVTSRLD